MYVRVHKTNTGSTARTLPIPGSVFSNICQLFKSPVVIVSTAQELLSEQFHFATNNAVV